jgi:hypothetical protein
MLISLADLPDSLRQHITALRECVRLALDDFTTDHRDLRVRYSARTEASIIHDNMVWYAKDRFPWKLKRNLFLIQVGRDFVAKLKKINAGWRVSGIQTQLFLNFDTQQQMQLFDDLDLTHLYLGYERDHVEISKSKIWLVCPDGKHGFKFIADLTEDGGTINVAVPAAPVAPVAPVGRRIKPKAPAADAGNVATARENDKTKGNDKE